MKNNIVTTVATAFNKLIRYLVMEHWYSVIEYALLLGPLLLLVFIPMPLSIKTILAIAIIIVLYRYYLRWRKSKIKEPNNNT